MRRQKNNQNLPDTGDIFIHINGDFYAYAWIIPLRYIDFDKNTVKSALKLVKISLVFYLSPLFIFTL